MSDPSPPASGKSSGGQRVGLDSAQRARVRVSRASGAGGQHVNKTSSRVEIFWNIPASRALTDEQRARLLDKLSSKLTTEGSIRVVGRRARCCRRSTHTDGIFKKFLRRDHVLLTCCAMRSIP